MATTTTKGGAGKVSKPAGKASKAKASKASESAGPKGTPGVVSGGTAKEIAAKGGEPIGNVPVPPHLRGKVGAKDVRDGGSKYGLKTGLRMTHFADALLLHNATRHATDADLQATLQAEFPKRVSKASGVQGVPTIQAISAYRAYFNAKKHGHNTGPGNVQSVSYRDDGSERGSDSPAPKGKGKGKGK